MIGRTTSGMWSYTEARPLAMGYLNRKGGVTSDFVQSASFEIEVAGDRVPATASMGSFYPAKARVHM